MSGDAELVNGLVDRLTRRLPHKTWPSIDHLHRDEVMVTMRATLVEIGTTNLSIVLDSLFALLESLASRYSSLDAHPSHVVQSEFYVLGLIADCCSSHWRSVGNGPTAQSTAMGGPTMLMPEPLDDGLVARIFTVLKGLVRPIPDGYVLPAQTILDEISLRNVPIPGVAGPVSLPPTSSSSNSSDSNNNINTNNNINFNINNNNNNNNNNSNNSNNSNSNNNTNNTNNNNNNNNNNKNNNTATTTTNNGAQQFDGSFSFSSASSQAAPDMEAYIKAVVEYTTASSWACCFDYFRNIIYSVRTATIVQPNQAQGGTSGIDERSALTVLRLVSFFWVDGSRLGALIQEICSSFLHFRKSFQHTVAVVTPLLVIRWLDRFPHEFVRMHTLRRRLDGGADTLFDMTQTFAEGGKRKALLYPLQTTLLFLIPDVFEVASNLREAKGGTNLAKKVAFLDGLRKAMRNRNDQAGYCLVSLLRAARHFDAENDAAIVSYAMDVQHEVRDAVFRKTGPSETSPFDQGMMTAAFVSLAHVNLEGCIDNLVPQCLHPTAPLGFKVAAIQACCYFARQQQKQKQQQGRDPGKYQKLIDSVVPFVQGQLRAISSTGAAPVATKGSSSSSDMDSPLFMVCTVLEFLDASPASLFGSPGQQSPDVQFDSGDIFESFLKCVISPDETVQRLASRVGQNLFADAATIEVLRSRGTFASRPLRVEFWMRSSYVLLGFCERISISRATKQELAPLRAYLESRLLVLKHIRELAELGNELADMSMASSKLETVLLVSLCAADIETCQLVTACINLFLEESSIVGAASEIGKASATLLRNAEVFREIASPAFRFTGLVAFQKRIGGLMRRMQSPTYGVLGAWKAGFEKWIHLCKDVSTSEADSLDEKTFAEWRNYSGFLASLGGICTSQHAGAVAATVGPVTANSSSGSASDDHSLRWIDLLSSGSEEPLLGRFLRLSIQLLACSNFKVREAMRDVLSLETSPALYQALFRALDSELDVLFAGALASPDKGQDGEIVFAEQAISLLRALVDRLETPADMGAASSIHLGSLTLNFVKFLDGVADSTGALLRAKIKVCQLCEAVTRRKEHLNPRDDFRIRNQLVEHIFSWTRPRSPAGLGGGGGGGGGNGNSAGGHQDNAGRVHRDLDRACLRSLAELTYRLPLQPGEGQADAATSEMKSQMFDAYFNRFLSVLNSEHRAKQQQMKPPLLARADNDSPTVSDLAITILSNLLSANIDVGLKHSLSIGYHENSDIRTAFVKVLYNILVQGTEFSNFNDDSVMEKYELLLEILTKDLTLVTSMSACCPNNEADELTTSLLAIFEHRGMAFDLLDALIKQEIDETENESQILRRNCIATKMLSIYAKWKGQAYLKATLQKVLERLMLTADDLDLELDPERVSSPDELQKNAVQLQIVTKVLIADICASSARIPNSFRRICNMIFSAVLPRFPEAKYTAVGAFIFLRFFCPAIVTPETEGLVSTTPSKDMRRGLLLIAKVIQNLANNVLFGSKENYMYPLNDFLAENIYRVTGFLREISAPIDPADPSRMSESFDFGSCVSLHRFLYEYGDQVRQKLLSQERRDYARSPGELSRGRSPVLEGIRGLVTNLGPPPLAVTWNRPQITMNTLPVYSRFQNFMLRQASRSNEAVVTSRAVYDGGESKDGLPIICVILRYIDTDGIDYDGVIYGQLKIASRMWHRPFGILIDATCFNGQHEPADETFKKLEQLAPAELSQNLARIYVYNMNSAFRKCFRRLLRVCTRHEHGCFNPRNVHYNLLGSLQELQSHFHLSQLHLPKDTISVVTDTRYVYQPITKLSRTKGKVEVVIKVGGQFIQITTTEKQDIFSGYRLDTTINDIFRLCDVDEAATSIQTEDDSAFGLRADNGKIVMYFTSNKKHDVLSTIRGAKSKYAKDSRSPKAYERLIRPQDVPGTLLNIALTNLGSGDACLRQASYNLLGALCRAFKFEAASKLVCARDVAVPPDASTFIVGISRQLARSERQLTLDFLTEFFVGWDSFHAHQKPLSLAYMAPWLPGLRTGFLAAEMDGEKAREKLAAVFRKLVQIATSDTSLTYTFEQAVWPVIAQDELLMDILLDEVVKAAIACGSQSQRVSILASVLGSIGSISLRGRMISRLRKTLNRSSLRPTKHLPDNAVWGEICVLLRFCMALAFDHGPQAQLYLPEIFHIVTMLSNTGTGDIRLLVYHLLVNSVHAACSSFALDDAKFSRLRTSLDGLCETPRSNSDMLLLGSGGGSTTASTAVAVLAKWGVGSPMLMQGSDAGAPTLAATESLAATLFDMCAVAAPSINTTNVWRSRWMSLVASTAFQNNPAIQPRAFAVMGCLARDEVDDDLLYQVLVALRHSLVRFGDDGNADMLVSIMSSLAKMMAKLPSASRYGMQMFWLAISLLRLVPVALFNCAAHFLEAVLTNSSTSGEFHGDRMVSILLQGRDQLQEATVPLDDAYGIHFGPDNFDSAVCACLVRGLTDTATRSATLRVLSFFLGMTTAARNAAAAAAAAASASATAAAVAATAAAVAATTAAAAATTAATAATGTAAAANAGTARETAPEAAAGEAAAAEAGTAAAGAGMGTSNGVDEQKNLLSPALLASPYLRLILARVSGPEELKECLWLAGINVRSVAGLLESRGLAELSAVRDRELLLSTAIELVDFHHLDDSVQIRTLLWLNELALVRPDVMVHLCSLIRSTLRSVLDESESSATVDSAHKLLRVVTCTPTFARAGSTGEQLEDLLEDMGFGGLWSSCTARPGRWPDKELLEITEKLIDASLA